MGGGGGGGAGKNIVNASGGLAAMPGTMFESFRHLASTFQSL